MKTYNKMIRILVAFECVWFDAWVAQVDKAKAGLHATLIVRHPTTRKLYINFDPGEELRVVSAPSWSSQRTDAFMLPTSPPCTVPTCPWQRSCNSFASPSAFTAWVLTSPKLQKW